jgi:hypothetical protein
LQTAVVVPTPWWRRITKLFERKVRPVGARPKRHSGLLTTRGLGAALRRVLLVAAVLTGLLYAVSPAMRGAVNGLVTGVKNKIESAIFQKPVHPISTEATAVLPDHPGNLATDELTDTFWAAPNAAAQPKLVLTFDHPTQLVQATVYNGDTKNPLAFGRPKVLHVVFFSGTTVKGVSDVTLEDKPDKQGVPFTGGDGATRVEIQVSSVYPGQNPGLALSEIELFERK